jgi:hypothetical protein
MAAKTELATPLTLVANQAIRVAKGNDSAIAYNDSQRNSRHYRDVPNDDSNEGLIRWANLPSIEEPDGTYMIAVSMSEYVYTGSGTPAKIVATGINGLASQNKMYEPEDGKKMFPIAGTINIEGPRVVFRKLVWVNSDELLLGTAAQEKALKEKLKKEQEDLVNKSIAGAGLNVLGDSPTNKYIIIIAVVLVILLLIFVVKKKSKNPEIQPQQQQQSLAPTVNVVRIPQKA